MANTQDMGLFALIDQGILDPYQDSSTVDSGLLVSAVNFDLAAHDAEIAQVMTVFCGTTTEFQMAVNQTGVSRSQPVDEFGRAIPGKPIPPYTVAFPVQGSGNAIGETFLARNLLTVKAFSDQLKRMLRGDALWVRDHVLAALFDNAGYTFTDPLGHGSLNVKGLANGDAVVYYNAVTGTEATDTHYLAQAAGPADATDPYAAARTELLKHNENDGDVISFIASDLVAATKLMSDFHSAQLDPDIALGDNTAQLTATLGVTLPPRAKVIGKVSSVWVVEWPSLPSTYIVTVTTAGPRPIMRRQFPQDALKGFKSVGTRQDFPYFESQWQRWEGYGAFNRVGAVVTRTGNASYAVPSGYATVMP